jgi:hypothetical protein
MVGSLRSVDFTALPQCVVGAFFCPDGISDWGSHEAAEIAIRWMWSVCDIWPLLRTRETLPGR